MLQHNSFCCSLLERVINTRMKLAAQRRKKLTGTPSTSAEQLVCAVSASASASASVSVYMSVGEKE